MGKDLSEENRAILRDCIAKVLGHKVREINASDLVQLIPDPAKALDLITADKQAARLYVREMLRAINIPVSTK